ncbi:protein FAR1-RELATED SEQUENCE 1-like [Camellia sinensis]|uniref:protein FAR1-RELATED SEQUENCE 1-like n=1 Tax=Camellia sinensis TaxID=4442 RepID=UPI001035B4C2|nr:protein FAR1-RELATED SEQUENCE 1-like [Camellia sinensis]
MGGLKFGCDFKTWIFGYEDEHELVEAWDSLIHKYNLQENLWIKKTWELREKWAHVYMKLVYAAGMRSTQLSESLNAELKRNLKVDHNIIQFFTHFNRVVLDKRYEEVKAIYDSRQQLLRIKLKMSPMLIQVAKLYTRPIFDLFHNELNTSLHCQVKQCHELEREVTYVIGLYREDREYIVKDAKDCAIEKTITVVENDPKLVIAARYKDLCPRMVKLAARSSECKLGYQLVEETLRDLCAKVDNMMTSLDGSGTSGSGGNIEVGTKEFVVDPNFAQAKGLKKKEGGHKGGSRLKPWHEKTTKRTKFVLQPTRLTQNIGQSSNTRNIQNSSSNHTSGLGFDLAKHNPMVAESIFRNDSLFDFFSHSEPPSPN